MTTQPQNFGLAAGIAANMPDEDRDVDPARNGVDPGAGAQTRDSDGVPVGRADAEADAIRSGADPDDR